MRRQCLTLGKSSLSSSPSCFFSPLPPPPGRVFFLLRSPPSPPLGKPPPVNPLAFPLVPHPAHSPQTRFASSQGLSKAHPTSPKSPVPFSWFPAMSPAWHGQALSGTPRPVPGMLRSSYPASALGPAPLDLISLPVHPSQCFESRVRRSLRSPDPHLQSGPSAVTHLQLPPRAAALLKCSSRVRSRVRTPRFLPGLHAAPRSPIPGRFRQVLLQVRAPRVCAHIARCAQVRAPRPAPHSLGSRVRAHPGWARAAAEAAAAVAAGAGAKAGAGARSWAQPWGSRSACGAAMRASRVPPVAHRGRGRGRGSGRGLARTARSWSHMPALAAPGARRLRHLAPAAAICQPASPRARAPHPAARPAPPPRSPPSLPPSLPPAAPLPRGPVWGTKEPAIARSGRTCPAARPTRPLCACNCGPCSLAVPGCVPDSRGTASGHGGKTRPSLAAESGIPPSLAPRTFSGSFPQSCTKLLPPARRRGVGSGMGCQGPSTHTLSCKKLLESRVLAPWKSGEACGEADLIDPDSQQHYESPQKHPRFHPSSCWLGCLREREK